MPPHRHGRDRAQQILERRLFQRKALDAGVERLRQQSAVVEPRIEEYRRAGRRALHAPGELDAAELRHADVDQRDPWREPLDLFERLLAVSRTADDRDAAMQEVLRNGVEDGRMVVGDNAGDFFARLTGHGALYQARPSSPALFRSGAGGMMLRDDRAMDMSGDPLAHFHEWVDGTEMALATAAADGRPSVRMVLLKSADENGFTFFTNYDSRKGRNLAENPYAALLFHRPGLQVRVEGAVARVSPAESDAYWATRPGRLPAERRGLAPVAADRLTRGARSGGRGAARGAATPRRLGRFPAHARPV